MSVNMYKPKKANVEKLEKYVEKLRKQGILREDEPVGATGRQHNED